MLVLVSEFFIDVLTRVWLRILLHVNSHTSHDFQFTALVGKARIIQIIHDLSWVDVLVLLFNFSLRLAVIVKCVGPLFFVFYGILNLSCPVRWRLFWLSRDRGSGARIFILFQFLIWWFHEAALCTRFLFFSLTFVLSLNYLLIFFLKINVIIICVYELINGCLTCLSFNFPELFRQDALFVID